MHVIVRVALRTFDWSVCLFCLCFCLRVWKYCLLGCGGVPQQTGQIDIDKQADTHRQTDGQTDRHRHVDRQADTDRHRQTHKQVAVRLFVWLDVCCLLVWCCFVVVLLVCFVSVVVRVLSCDVIVP